MHTKRVASTAQSTQIIQWCALTWDGDRDGGGDTGFNELVAGGNETFQSGVQNVDRLLVDGLVQVIRLHPLSLFSVNLRGDGIDLAIYLQLVDLNLHNARRDVDRWY